MELSQYLARMGMESEALINFINVTVTLAIAGTLGWIGYIVAKKWLSRLVIRIAGKTATQWDDLMFDQKFFNRLAWLIFPIVVGISVSRLDWAYTHVLVKTVQIWITFAVVFLIAAVFDGADRIYQSYPVSRNRPIKVFIQIVLVFLYCAAIIVSIQIITGKPMAVLLAGLTAFAAVLMLIFQNSILGFVAGIQLSANDMVRIGDWIVMPSSNADGDVLEINLTTVKVQNWDKTITTIPTHKLVAESFTNWRGMEESKGRRIKRSVNIDVNSIHYLSPQEIETLKQSELLRDYIEKKTAEIEEFNRNRSNVLDARRLTNIGTFREYMESWLSYHPDINLSMTHMVRQLQPGPTGLPLEIYCFSARQRWVDYERVQADIFDHVFAVMDMFNLKTFQYTGNIPVAGDVVN